MPYPPIGNEKSEGKLLQMPFAILHARFSISLCFSALRLLWKEPVLVLKSEKI